MTRAALLVPLVVLAGTVSAHAQQDDDAAPAAADAAALRQTVAEQSDLIRRLIARMTRMEARIDELEARTGAADGEDPASADSTRADTASPAASGADDSADTSAAQAQSAAGAERAVAESRPANEADGRALPELSEAERREQERLVRAAFQRTLIERGGLLLPPRTFDVEPSLSYVHSSADDIVIDGFTILPVLVVGDIVSERVKRNQTQLSTTMRFGLPWDSQLELRVPFSYEERRSFSADNMEDTRSSSGLGDVDIGFSRQLTRGAGRWPDLLASLRWKTTTGKGPFDVPAETDAEPAPELAIGTGYDSLNLALTAVKVVDPVVYFGSVSYSRNFARDETVGRIDAGDTSGISLGMAVALNLNSSLSFAYDQRRTQRTRIDGLGVPGSYATTGMFSVGASFAVSDMLTADLSLGVGVTEDSPDMQVRASFPIRLRR